MTITWRTQLIHLPAWLLSSTVHAQTIHLQTGERNIAIVFYKHPFRGPEATLLYTEENAHRDLYFSATYIVKSWLLGPMQNFYVSTGPQIVATDAGANQINALSWRTRLRYEPRTWQNIQIVGAFDFSPRVTTFEDGRRINLGTLQLEYLAGRQTSIVAGWRQLNAHFENGDQIDVSRGGFIGLRYDF